MCVCCFLESIPIISISDLKDIINNPANTSERVDKICKLKEKINKIIEDDCWDLGDILLEHNYAILMYLIVLYIF